jgi:hypothetical protein
MADPGPPWRAMDGGRRSRHASVEAATRWVKLHHRGARQWCGGPSWWDYRVGKRVVAVAWPVRRSPDWWVAMAPMDTVGW